MAMKNPVHPGALVQDSLEHLDLSVAEAAAGLGISRQQLHNIIAKRSGITPDMALRLEMALGSTAETWLRMQVNYDLAQARKGADHLAVKSLVPKDGPISITTGV